MPEKICPECGIDLDADPKRDPEKHAVRHWGDLDKVKKSEATSKEIRRRIKILEDMAKHHKESAT